MFFGVKFIFLDWNSFSYSEIHVYLTEIQIHSTLFH